MKVAKLSDMKGGWFIGNFEPSLYKTNDCEVAVKTYKKGDFEAAHFHKIATEYTIVASGKVMNLLDLVFRIPFNFYKTLNLHKQKKRFHRL